MGGVCSPAMRCPCGYYAPRKPVESSRRTLWMNSRSMAPRPSANRTLYQRVREQKSNQCLTMVRRFVKTICYGPKSLSTHRPRACPEPAYERFSSSRCYYGIEGDRGQSRSQSCVPSRPRYQASHAKHRLPSTPRMYLHMDWHASGNETLLVR